MSIYCLVNQLCFVLQNLIYCLSFTDQTAPHQPIPRDIDDNTDLDVDENFSHHGSDAQPSNCSNVNKQLSTQNDVIGNVHENTAYTNKDNNSVLCDKELCEGTIKSSSCTRCKMSFTSMEELTSHCATHKTTVKHQCNMCDKRFSQKGHLMRHLRIHSGERPFQCAVCDKGFIQKYNLTIHSHVHSGERPFKCTLCDKQFKQKNTLTKHLFIHNGERPFQCTLCDKRFARKSNVTSHLRVHIGERPFQCTLCDKRFKHKNSLTAHLRVHNGERPFQCTFCEKRFKRKGDLTTHLRIHSGERPFQVRAELRKCEQDSANDNTKTQPKVLEAIQMDVIAPLPPSQQPLCS